MRLASRIFIVTVAVAFLGQPGWAQTAPAPAPVVTTQTQQKPNDGMDSYRGRETVEKTFYFNYATGQNDLNEIVTAIRNVIPPEARIYMVPGQKAMVVRVVPERPGDHSRRFSTNLTGPRRRIGLHLHDLGDGRRQADRLAALRDGVDFPGQRTLMKQGSKVPVVTGMNNKESGTMENAVSYLDIGMNFDATLEESANEIVSLHDRRWSS